MMTIVLPNKEISMSDYCYYNHDGLYISKELIEEISNAFIYETVDNTMMNTIQNFFRQIIDGIEKEYGIQLSMEVHVNPYMKISISGKNIHIMSLDNIKALNLKNILGEQNEIFLPSGI